jgi:hypothetical protein
LRSGWNFEQGFGVAWVELFLGGRVHVHAVQGVQFVNGVLLRIVHRIEHAVFADHVMREANGFEPA